MNKQTLYVTVPLESNDQLIVPPL